MNESSKRNSYKSILKGTSFLGGTQIFQILINALRGKFVAMFLGVDGMGISTLFATPAATIQRFASLGLNLAIVKEVAEAKENPQRLSALVATVRRLILITSLLGAFITILLSGWLSEASFADRSHTKEFIALSLMIFFTVAGNGEMSILQGLHRVKTLSKAAIVGSLTGLFIGVPLYYLFGYDGIVPAMIVLALTTFIFYTFSVRKAISSSGFQFKWKENTGIIRQLLSIGLILMASDLIGSACTYILNIFLRMMDGLNTVGLFQAANSLTNQYSSIVFAAMAMDYLPRLTAVSNDNKEMNDVVNRQSEIVSFIIMPVVCLVLLFAPLVIKILYTTEFLDALNLLQWMSMGILVKALSYPMGYITFAKDNKKLFFWLEGILGNFQTLILSIIGFYIFGLNGLGYALLADSILCFIIYLIVNNRMYGYTLTTSVSQCFLLAIILPAITYLTLQISTEITRYALATLTVTISIIISYKQIKKRWKQ